MEMVRAFRTVPTAMRSHALASVEYQSDCRKTRDGATSSGIVGRIERSHDLPGNQFGELAQSCWK